MSPPFELLLLGVFVWNIYILKRGFDLMANNLDRLRAAVQAVVDAIRNPAANDQAALDELANNLEAAVLEENAEDGA